MKLDDLLDRATHLPHKTVAVACADDEEVIKAVEKALDLNLASFLLYGNGETITKLLNRTSDHITVIDTPNPQIAAEEAVKAVHNKKADILMKGLISTSVILKAVLNKEYGLRTGKTLSHIAVFEIPGYNQLKVITDPGMNVQPSLTEKVDIINNAVSVTQSIGIDVPKVAVLAAVEVVNPNMQATVDAALLTQMNKRGQIKNCLIDGPLALDNAISLDAAEQKGIHSDVAGRADILLVPTIETGNVLYKSLMYFAKAKVGAVVAGARAPIVLTSRADTFESKLYSLALAVCSASK